MGQGGLGCHGPHDFGRSVNSTYINQGVHFIPTTLLLAQPLRIFRSSYILSKSGVVGINLDFYPCVENDFVNVVPKCYVSAEISPNQFSEHLYFT